MADDLNPSQRAAVETLVGPMLVLAGAGAGKTRVVTFRIARLIRSGIAADRILAVTFTNKAAREMQQRISKLLGARRDAPKPEISTFHSLCVRILRRQITRLDYPANFTICDRGDQESTARRILRELSVPNESLRPRDALSIISRWKSAGLRPADTVATCRTDKEHLASMAYRRYQAALQTAGAVDFDDLLLLTEELLTRHEEVRRAESARFDHILVDEYQDTNASQYRIVEALARDARNLCVVGDDDQSIYGWRGAEVQHILNFRRDWPAAKVVRLEENYRSTAQILAFANRLIGFNATRHDKQLRPIRREGEPPRVLQFADDAEEAKALAEEIAARLKADPTLQPRDLAILFRTNQQPRPFEEALRKADLPYVLVGGMSFFDRKEVRDVLAYLRVIANPLDEESLRRVINTPPRGIGPAAVKKMMATATERATPLWNVLRDPAALQGLPPPAVAGAERFVRMISAYGRNSARPSELITGLVDRIRYEQELERLYPNEEERGGRWQAVQDVVNSAADYERASKSPSLTGFLDAVTLDSPEDRDKEEQLARNAIALMTLHAAKGLEFPEVYLVGMEEGVLPHARSIAGTEADIEEERRLCYVGVTRAMGRLTLTLPLSRRKWGKARPTIPSRFLYELLGKADNPNAQRIRAGKRPVAPPHGAGRPSARAGKPRGRR